MVDTQCSDPPEPYNWLLSGLLSEWAIRATLELGSLAASSIEFLPVNSWVLKPNFLGNFNMKSGDTPSFFPLYFKASFLASSTGSLPFK